MPTRIEWRSSDDAEDPPGTLMGHVVYSSTKGAVRQRVRRHRLHLRHVTHGRDSDGVCRVCLKPWPCPTPSKQAEIPSTQPFRLPLGPTRDGDPDPAACADARDFIADWLRDEEGFETPESFAWFAAVADHIASVPTSDARVVAAARFLGPLLDDEEGRIEAVIYPNGATVQFVDRMPWGGDQDAYFSRFVNALGRDFADWLAIVARDGPDARWPAASLR